MELQWKLSAFNELTNLELYAILQLRNTVFIVEQNCVYQDLDDKDQKGFHLCAWQDNQLAAYCRVLPPGVSYPEASIGRIATAMAHRKAGYGRRLVQSAINMALEKFNCKKITISAQAYLQHFYESFGFVKKGEMYLEDEIPHIKMKLGN